MVTRQQKQQHGNQLAKETDRLMKAFSALPIGPDQVCWTKNKFFPKQSFKAALSKRKNVPKGAIKDYVSYRIVLFLGFSLNIFFLCFLLAAKEDTERASAERLLRRPEQLPEDPAAGGRRRERVCGQSQSQLQGVGE